MDDQDAYAEKDSGYRQSAPRGFRKGLRNSSEHHRSICSTDETIPHLLLLGAAQDRLGVHKGLCTSTGLFFSLDAFLSALWTFVRQADRFAGGGRELCRTDDR